MYICKAAETDILHNADKIELPPSQLTPPAQTIFVAVQNMSNNLWANLASERQIGKYEDRETEEKQIICMFKAMSGSKSYLFFCTI